MITAASDQEFLKLEKQLQLKKLEVSSLLEVTQAINNNLPVENLFRIYQFILHAQISVNKIAVYVKDEEFDCICTHGIDEVPEFSELEPELVEIKRTTFTADIPTRLLSDFYVIIPVYHKDEALAFALIGKPDEDEYETLDEKIRFIQTITNIIVVASENKKLFKEKLEQERIERDLQFAREVQRMLIPAELPQSPDLALYAFYEPHRNIGGDYYDVIPLGQDKVLMCVADVSGKGMSAALLMANFQAVLHTLAATAANLESLVQQLNARMYQNTVEGTFVTMFLAEYERSSRTLRFANAGHNPPLLAMDGEVQPLEATSTVIGIVDQLPEVVGSIKLNKDATLLLFTDGLVEASNDQGEQYGSDRLTEFVQQHRSDAPSELIEALKEEITGFSAGPRFDDDITLVACRLKA